MKKNIYLALLSTTALVLLGFLLKIGVTCSENSCETLRTLTPIIGPLFVITIPLFIISLSKLVGVIVQNHYTQTNNLNSPELLKNTILSFVSFFISLIIIFLIIFQVKKSSTSEGFGFILLPVVALLSLPISYFSKNIILSFEKIKKIPPYLKYPLSWFLFLFFQGLFMIILTIISGILDSVF